MILGTAAYMSPEQANGKSVDRRADIWAFGCVLYEMLAGQQPFEGETISDTLAAVLKDAPILERIPADAPRDSQTPSRCLVKDPKQRLQAIGEARIAIEELATGCRRSDSAGDSTRQTPPQPGWHRSSQQSGPDCRPCGRMVAERPAECQAPTWSGQDAGRAKHRHGRSHLARRPHACLSGHGGRAHPGGGDGHRVGRLDRPDEKPLARIRHGTKLVTRRNANLFRS